MLEKFGLKPFRTFTTPDHGMTITVSTDPAVRVSRVYHLITYGVEVLIDEKSALKLIVGMSKSTDIVWSINESNGSHFYDPDYPEWSLKPHPKSLVAGNIYYDKQQAHAVLVKALRKHIQDKREKAEIELGVLEGIFKKITNPDYN